MLRDNETPLPAIAFEQTHRDRRAMAVTTARARYLLHPDGDMKLAPEQALVLSDIYDGPPHTTPLVRTSDLTPFKPAADITFVGDAYAPGGEPATSWTAGVKIGEQVFVLRVHGPRQWEPVAQKGAPAWRLTPAQKAAFVPLDYRLASGGRVIGDPRGAADERNPIGAGLIDPKVTSPYFAYDAPQIERDGEPLRSIADRPDPAGFGPVPPAWRGRAPHFGTVDVAAVASGGPRLPADHDYSYWQVAPPELRRPGYLAAGEVVTLGRLTPGGGVLAFALPDEEPYARYTFRDGREVAVGMHRDGLHIDARGAPPWTVEITFRTWVEMCPQSHVVHLAMTDAAGASDMPAATVEGLRQRGDA